MGRGMGMGRVNIGLLWESTPMSIKLGALAFFTAGCAYTGFGSGMKDNSVAKEYEKDTDKGTAFLRRPSIIEQQKKKEED